MIVFHNLTHHRPDQFASWGIPDEQKGDYEDGKSKRPAASTNGGGSELIERATIAVSNEFWV
jgi:hypothetical protein